MSRVSLRLTVSAPGGAPGGAPPPPLHATLRFADGKTLEFDAAKAADLGDYVGPFVRQKCVRQVASGNGDYRDAFLVDFRPDADGKRDEVVIEFGTLTKFPANATPVPASNVAPLHLGVPPAPILTKVPTGGTTTQAGSLFVAITYLTPEGETPASLNQIVLAAGQLVHVASPPPGMGATAYNVYAQLYGTTAAQTSILQNAAPIPIGTDWTEPASGALIVGTNLLMVRPPTSAYKVTISGGNLAAPIVVRVPAHYWRARWRWQSAPRPIVRRLADVVAMKAILPLDAKYAYGARPPAALPWQGPMDNGPVLTKMGSGGGRNDLGFMTEWSAAFLVTEDPGAEASMRAAAEATGTLAIWPRDVATGALVDTSTVSRYPCYVDGWHGPQQLPTVPGGIASWSYMYPNESHLPALAFVPWLLTDDPYFLEGAQAAALYGIMETNLFRDSEKKPSIGSLISPRAWAWNLRDIFQQAGWAPETPPGWMLPRSFFRDHALSDSLAYAMPIVSNSGAKEFPFGIFPNWKVIPSFMTEYVCITMAWAKWSGKFPDWDAVVEYVSRSRRAMSDPGDLAGWDHRMPEPYFIPIGTAKTFAELFQSYLKLAPSSVPSWDWPADPTKWPVDGLALREMYSPWIRTSLAALSLAGLPRAREGHDWIARQLDKVHDFASVGFTWAIPPE